MTLELAPPHTPKARLPRREPQAAWTAIVSAYPAEPGTADLLAVPAGQVVYRHARFTRGTRAAPR
ncbi:hypothetical protein [Streptomyces sp. S.PB5]|uniref:hypothetical protein n=1 Tax=Streptomyces sp. S.PB5 TaxID=3020844 RepID=UPI0025AF7ED9|nr:hypothetical protein [Streptomyces sp. S.PB5]MDN3025994.1 hypothetical protein [Streptomyces sp. S.PB5]